MVWVGDFVYKIAKGENKSLQSLPMACGDSGSGRSTFL